MMKAIIPLLFVALFQAVAFSQTIASVAISTDGSKEVVYYRPDKEPAREYWDKNGTLRLRQGRVPNGTARAYSAGRALLWEWNVKNGALNGLSKSYFENGKVRGVAVYIDDRREGVSREYYPSGKLFAATPYLKGKLSGTATQYYESGVTSATWSYREEPENYSFRHYYDNGALKDEGNVVNGMTEGVVKAFNNSGWLMAEINFGAGLRNGPYKCYFQNSTLEKAGAYKDGKLDGLCRMWHKNGRISAEAQLVEGNVIGIEKRYKENGSLTRRIHYWNGKPIPFWKCPTDFKGFVQYVKEEIQAGPPYLGSNIIFALLLIVFVVLPVVILKKLVSGTNDENFNLISNNIPGNSVKNKVDDKIKIDTDWSFGNVADDAKKEREEKIYLLRGDSPVEFFELDEAAEMAVAELVDLMKENKQEMGMFSLHYPDGKLHLDASVRDGLLEGSVKLYYENGHLMFDGNFLQGEPDGVVKFYRDNGTFIGEQSLRSGVLDGVCKEYDENGKLLYTETYHNGEIISHQPNAG